MNHVRVASKVAVCVGVGLLIISTPIEAITGIVGAVTLIITGTVGCIESNA